MGPYLPIKIVCASQCTLWYGMGVTNRKGGWGGGVMLIELQ